MPSSDFHIYDAELLNPAEAFFLAMQERMKLAQDPFFGRGLDHYDRLLFDVASSDRLSATGFLNLQEGLHLASLLAQRDIGPEAKPRITVNEHITTAGNLAITWRPGHERRPAEAPEWRHYVQAHFREFRGRPDDELLFLHGVRDLRIIRPGRVTTKMDSLALLTVDTVLRRTRAVLEQMADVAYYGQLEVVSKTGAALGLDDLRDEDVPAGFIVTNPAVRSRRDVEEQLRFAAGQVRRSVDDFVAAFRDNDDRRVATALFGERFKAWQLDEVSIWRSLVRRALDLDLVARTASAKEPESEESLALRREALGAAVRALYSGESVARPQETVTRTVNAREAPQGHPVEVDRSFYLRRPRLLRPVPVMRQRGDLYAGLRVYPAPAEELAGFPDAMAAVRGVNEILSEKGRPTVPQGDFPSSKDGWRRFTKTYAKELEAAAALLEEGSTPAP